MNQTFDKEIDALLRRNSRTAARRGAPEDDGATSTLSAHLDADELSAFAENALPAQARSLYVAHLADCAECRRDVARLAGASNVPVESVRRVAAEVSGPKAAAWRDWLGALFAPSVMRFAVPALALCLVGVIAFIALRSRESAGLVAQKESDESNGRAGITRESSTPAPGADASISANQNSMANEVKEADSSSKQSLAQRPESEAEGAAAPKDQLASGPSQPSSVSDAAQPPPAPAGQVSESVSVVGGRGATGAASAAPKETREVARVAEDSQREAKSENNLSFEQNQQAANKSVQPRKVDIDQMPDGSRGAARGDSNNVGSRANSPTLSRRSGAEDDEQRAAPPAATKRARTAEPRGGRDDDTTTVSGHRFRRQDGAWVDVNYSASLPQTGVRRGTDGYRALVADLPEVGRIAEQLRGEVVIVIKGRAYRVR
ncbi:MAG: hypothetical protein H0T60_17390 [Acidobacteria bacterium]|nr:hypothetical protein [Acidobacteriota bacterium]